MEFNTLFNRNESYRDCVLEEYDRGKVKVSTIVNESNTNPYGTTHGGYIYTLCDTVAGLVGYSLGGYTVTVQGNISYMKAGKLNDRLTITGTCLHNGNKIKTVEVSVTNQDEMLLSKAIFTLYETKSLEDNE